ncbi:uncharacterized protein LOC120219194 [Hibiscus syriacus]|uniref:uncharacterized protein LOC120219194 n=1 Tax=Hibiscus syriacus TaxID=106335 RepID=UPI00192385A9|nr:uncharacterized protein LOC120219194 [Hibiscus syriacus]
MKMKSLSSVGVGLSIVFGCLLLALIAEIYYLLWWKNRLRTSSDLENDFKNPEIRFAEEQQCHHRHQQQQHNLQPNKDLMLKPFDGDHGNGNFEQQPGFLFTIIEETMEDLESLETPYLTPLASPPFFTPPLTPIDVCFAHQFGFNPLFESRTDADFDRLTTSSSPPSTRLKFLQEAELKLHRETLMEDVHNNGGLKFSSAYLGDEEDGSFITIIVDKSKEEGFDRINQQQIHTSFSGTSS